MLSHIYVALSKSLYLNIRCYVSLNVSYYNSIQNTSLFYLWTNIIVLKIKNIFYIYF